MKPWVRTEYPDDKYLPCLYPGRSRSPKENREKPIFIVILPSMYFISFNNFKQG